MTLHTRTEGHMAEHKARESLAILIRVGCHTNHTNEMPPALCALSEDFYAHQGIVLTFLLRSGSFLQKSSRSQHQSTRTFGMPGLVEKRSLRPFNQFMHAKCQGAPGAGTANLFDRRGPHQVLEGTRGQSPRLLSTVL